MKLIFFTFVIASTIIGSSGCATAEKDVIDGSLRGYTEDVFQLSAQADTAYRESRWIDASRLYQGLTRQVPQDAYVWFRLGNTYAKQGAYDEAIHAYQRSIERNPEQPKPWFNLSTAYMLSAQQAMHNAWSKLRPGDPARALIASRMQVLQNLMHDRFEDSTVQTSSAR